MHASGSKYGSLGRLIVEAQGATAKANLDVLDRQNAALYWERDSRHDTVISVTYGRPALDALVKAKPTSSKGVYLRKIAVSSTMGVGVRVEQASLSA